MRWPSHQQWPALSSTLRCSHWSSAASLSLSESDQLCQLYQARLVRDTMLWRQQPLLIVCHHLEDANSFYVLLWKSVVSDWLNVTWITVSGSVVVMALAAINSLPGTRLRHISRTNFLWAHGGRALIGRSQPARSLIGRGRVLVSVFWVTSLCNSETCFRGLCYCIECLQTLQTQLTETRENMFQNFELFI